MWHREKSMLVAAGRGPTPKIAAMISTRVPCSRELFTVSDLTSLQAMLASTAAGIAFFGPC